MTWHEIRSEDSYKQPRSQNESRWRREADTINTGPAILKKILRVVPISWEDLMRREAENENRQREKNPPETLVGTLSFFLRHGKEESKVFMKAELRGDEIKAQNFALESVRKARRSSPRASVDELQITLPKGQGVQSWEDFVKPAVDREKAKAKQQALSKNVIITK